MPAAAGAAPTRTTSTRLAGRCPGCGWPSPFPETPGVRFRCAAPVSTLRPHPQVPPALRRGARESIKREASSAPSATSPTLAKCAVQEGKEQPDRALITSGPARGQWPLPWHRGRFPSGGGGLAFYPGVRSAFKPAGLARAAAAAHGDPYRDEGGGNRGRPGFKKAGRGTGRRTPEKRGEPGGWRRWPPPSPPCAPPSPSQVRLLAGTRRRLLACPAPRLCAASPLLPGPPEEASAFKHAWSAPRPSRRELPGARYAQPPSQPGCPRTLLAATLDAGGLKGRPWWRVQPPAGRHAGLLPFTTGSSCTAHQPPPLITRSNCTSAGCSSIRSPSYFSGPRRRPPEPGRAGLPG